MIYLLAQVINKKINVDFYNLIRKIYKKY